MSLQKFEDNEQETFYPFSREILKKQAERIRQKKFTSTKEETAEQPMQIPELENIETWATALAQQTAEMTEDSRRDERFLLMATATIKMCRLLKNFSEVMTAEMEQVKQNELQALNLQEQYEKSIRTSTVEVTRDIYERFRNEQARAFDDIKIYFNNSCNDIEKKLNACTKNVNSATVRAERASKQISRSVKRFCTVKTIGNFLYYSAPVAVLTDVLLRLFGFI